MLTMELVEMEARARRVARAREEALLTLLGVEPVPAPRRPAATRRARVVRARVAAALVALANRLAPGVAQRTPTT